MHLLGHILGVCFFNDMQVAGFCNFDHIVVMAVFILQSWKVRIVTPESVNSISKKDFNININIKIKRYRYLQSDELIAKSGWTKKCKSNVSHPDPDSCT